MDITKEEFNIFYETLISKYDGELIIKIPISKFLGREAKGLTSESFNKYLDEMKSMTEDLNKIKNDKPYFLDFLLMSLGIKFELRTGKIKNLPQNNIMEELTGLSEEKIAYIEKNFKELLEKINNKRG